MSVLDDIMAAGGVDVLSDALGDAEALEYGLPDGTATFKIDAILGREIGDQEFADADLVKIIRSTAICRTADLIAHKVLELQGRAKVIVAGREWSIDLTKSGWTPTTVMLGLRRRELSRFEEMENHAAVR